MIYNYSEFGGSPIDNLKLKRCCHCLKEHTKDGWFYCDIQFKKDKDKSLWVSPCDETTYRICPLNYKNKIS